MLRLGHRDIPEEATRTYPCIMWYNWKAKNDKMFNNVDRLHVDVIERALKESKEWFLVHEQGGTIPAIPLTEELLSALSVIFTCYNDGSWKEGDRTCGVGWVLELQDGTTDILGLHGGH